MSTASEIHNEIMEVLQEALEDKTTTYADVFGAIEITKAFFTCEYAMKMSSAWHKALAESDGAAPNVEVTGAARLYRAASVWTAGLCKQSMTN